MTTNDTEVFNVLVKKLILKQMKGYIYIFKIMGYE